MATEVSADLKRHVSCLIVALQFYPQMAIKMIHDFPPNMVLRMIDNDPNNKFRKSLDNSEKLLISTLSTDGFNKLDLSLLCKLIRHFDLVHAPSENWGKKPLPTSINQGDDMERMRNNYNAVIHRPLASLSEEEGNTVFKESIEIACRVDQFIGESTSSFETQILNARRYNITPEQSRQALGKCPTRREQLKDLSGINHIDLYYGDDIEIKLGHQESPATDSTLCTIHIRGGNINGPVTRIMVEQMNEESVNIKVVKSESGSLVLHVEINNICFSDKHSLHEAIAEFLQIVFTSINGSFEQHSMEVVLTECDSYIISDNEEENDDYSNNQESLVLKLGGMAMTSQHVDEAAACTASSDDKDARATQEDKTKEDSSILYRLLRPHEVCENGLRAKNPYSTTSMFDHVIKGRYGPPSKYISTCGSWEAMNSFRSNSTGRIVKIQKDKLPSSIKIIDLSREENRNQYIDNPRDENSKSKFHNFAKKFKVVLLVGHVPVSFLQLCDNEKHALMLQEKTSDYYKSSLKLTLKL